MHVEDARLAVERLERDSFDLYVANLIDHGRLAFARAALRTTTEVDHVAILAAPAVLRGKTAEISSSSPLTLRWTSSR